MTIMSPAQCLACTRLTPVVDQSTGAALVVRCTAYPEGIPVEIAAGLDDHRRPRGDEEDGLTFDRAHGAQADDAWLWWQRTSGAADAPPIPEPTPLPTD